MPKARDWVCVAAASCCLFTIQGFNRVRGLMYLELLDLYDRGPFLTSWLTSAPAISNIVSGCLTGYLLERTSPRILLSLGSLLNTACFIGTAFAPNLETVLLLFGFLQGFGAPFIVAVVYTLVNRRIHKLRQRANAIMFIGVSLLTVGYPYLVQILLETFSSRGTWMILGGITLQTCVLAAIIQAVPSDDSENTDTERIEKYIPTDNESLADIKVVQSVQMRCEERTLEDENISPKVHQNCLCEHTGCKGMCDIRNSHKTQDRQSELGASQPGLSKSDQSNGLRLKDNSEVSSLGQRILYSHSTITPNSSGHVTEGGSDTGIERSRDDQKRTVWAKLKSNKMLGLLTNRKFLTAVIWFSCIKMFFLFVTQFAPAYGEELGMSTTDRSTLISVYSAGELTMRLFLAIFGDSNWLKKDVFISMCGIAAGTISLLVTMYSSLWIISAFCFVSGLLGDAMTVFIGYLVVESVGVSNLDIAMGILPATAGIVTLVAPPIGGYLRETYGTYRYAIMCAGVTSFASFGAFAILGGRISSPLKTRGKSSVYAVTM